VLLSEDDDTDDHWYQLHTKFYPTFFFKVNSTQMKLLEIISVDFNTKDQLVNRYSAFV
jgi:hypothetical protein